MKKELTKSKDTQSKSEQSDFIRELGELAIGSRIKRLSEAMFENTVLIYKSLDIDFQPKWFTVFRLLIDKSPLPILVIARELRVTHPAINQVVGEMLQAEIVEESFDPEDKRKRLISLSDKGKTLIPLLEEVWIKIRHCVNQTIKDSGYPIMDCIDGLEKAFTTKSLYERFLES